MWPLACMDELWDVQLLHVHLDEVHQHLWLVPAVAVDVPFLARKHEPELPLRGSCMLLSCVRGGFGLLFCAILPATWMNLRQRTSHTWWPALCTYQRGHLKQSRRAATRGPLDGWNLVWRFEIIESLHSAPDFSVTSFLGTE